MGCFVCLLACFLAVLCRSLVPLPGIKPVSNSFVVGFPTVVKPEAGHRLVIRWDLTQDAKPGIAFSRAGA